jgi:hypothetical protein
MKLLSPIGLAAALLAAPALTAQEADPDWPCVQRRVEHLSLAVMWPQPVPETDDALPDELRGLAEQMALRRVSIEELGSAIDGLAAERPDLDADTYGRIFAAAFERIDRQRAQIVRGIARYAQGQATLASEIDALRAEFAELEAADEPDFDRLDQLDAEIDWRERLFDERNSALNYVCESPVLLERRAYEVAQLLLKRIE